MFYTQQRRALIVIDVQNEHVNGKFTVEYPPVESSLFNIAKAMDAAVQHDVPVVVVAHVLDQDSPIFAYGSDGVALYPSVANRPRAHFIQKTLPSVFSKTDFGPWLNANSIDTITAVGYMTHCCIVPTILEALQIGIRAEYLPDAAGSLPYRNRAGSASAEEIHRVASVLIQSAYAAVMSTDEWIDTLVNHTAPERDNPYISNLRALVAREFQSGDRKLG
jgi:nicotinamidase-related amidase